MTRCLGIDESGDTLHIVQVEKRGGAWLPTAATSCEGGPGACTEALKQAGVKERSAVGGLTGKDLVVRYHQVPTVPDWQLRKIMDFEIEEMQRQSGDDLAGDFNLLSVSSDLSSDDTVLLALTREQSLNERVDALGASGVKARFFTPNSLGLFHAFRLYGPAVDGDVVLLNLGDACSDVTVLRDGELLYARSVTAGGDALVDAVASEFNVTAAKAERLTQEFGDLRPRDQRRGLTAQQQKVSQALEAPAGRIFQMVQSTLQFARTQVQLNRLEPSHLFLSGSWSTLPGLSEFLQHASGMQVEVFDPLGESGVEPDGSTQTADYTVALGLAALGADPEAYRIEVLGSAARRRQTFLQRHLWSVAAVALVLIYLTVLAVTLSGDRVKAEEDQRKVSNLVRKRTNNLKNLQSFRDNRELLSRRVDFLEKRKAAGESLLRTLRVLGLHTPDELWMTELELGYEDSGPTRTRGEISTRAPEILVHGQGRSIGNRSADRAYQEFTDAVRADLGWPQRLVDSPSTVRNDFSFDLRFDFLAEPPPPSEDDDDDEGAE